MRADQPGRSYHQIEVDTGQGLPPIVVVGLPDADGREVHIVDRG